ncbi:hypothetical protein IFM89_038780 [Coptis chinensis]|uniref:Uncharacterized protein n=1 Tax=Coptis chinensis TaxID=261450 RepID=A0A835IZL4_9MAGN|nr:hypothetical protein IFM89_038780 [Coptis chinensis]
MYVLGVVARDYSLSGTLRKERALYCEGEKKCDNLEKAAELDPTLNYMYMYRAACLMRKQSVEAALAEINHVLGTRGLPSYLMRCSGNSYIVSRV